MSELEGMTAKQKLAYYQEKCTKMPWMAKPKANWYVGPLRLRHVNFVK